MTTGQDALRIVIHVSLIDPSPAAHAALALVLPGDISLVDGDADVYLVDPEGSGMATCSALAAEGRRVIVYADAPDDVVRLGARVAGAIAVVDKADSPDVLIDEIRRAMPRSLAAA